jgi:putative copper resistance protein D
VAISVVVAVCLAAGTHPYHALSNSDPGAVVRIGTPILRSCVDLAAALCVGSLGYVVLCTRPQDSGLVSPSGYRALSAATRWAGVWCVAVIVLVPFDTADTTGQPLSKVLTVQGFPALVSASEEPKAWLVTALLLLVLLPCCRATLRWRTVTLVCGLALLALLPPLATGHSSSETSHDLATDAIMVHVPAAVLWLGLLAAFIRQYRYTVIPFEELTRRYARVAGVCWWLVAAAGLADALVLTHLDQLGTTGYGLLVIASVAAMLTVGWLGSRLRRRALRSSARDAHATGAVIRLAALELLILAATMGASIALTRLAPPAFLDYRSTVSQQLLGYDLNGAPTPLRLLTDWRLDLLFGPLCCALAAGYVLAIRRIRARGEPWPVLRTICWLAGCLLLLLATCAGIGRYASAMFSIHMLRHMLIGMVVPVLLASGGPITLLQRAFPDIPGRCSLPGVPAWCAMLRDTQLMRFLTHPAVTLLLFAGSPFVLYDTSLFDQAVRFHWAHQAIDVYFLFVGYLFAWITVGSDPAPHRLPSLARVGLLLAAMPADVIFAAVVLNTHRIIGNGAGSFNFYQALDLPWVSSLASDQHAAGLIALVVGEIALLGALAALLPRWSPAADTDEATHMLAQHRNPTAPAPDRT